ncbi:Hypothetical protein ETEE_0479 [Edwardsiella anguillarum ET080813]|uniref:Uncharacterized protein n=1 Tax=Edwardsiella anguillarum ET080813 TaxID=667120 RepID=A0A076LJB2_9GAMM|nr:Hypothetical protein ETEE_0479 [Edwardsiella anguillarum ET080813]
MGAALSKTAVGGGSLLICPWLHGTLQPLYPDGYHSILCNLCREA